MSSTSDYHEKEIRKLQKENARLKAENAELKAALKEARAKAGALHLVTVLSRNVTSLGASMAVRHELEKNRCQYIWQVVEKTEVDLLGQQEFTRFMLKNLRTCLTKLHPDLRLGMDLSAEVRAQLPS